MEDTEKEQYLASAVQYLFEIGKGESAKKLLTCNIESMYTEDKYKTNTRVTHSHWTITLRGSAIFYKDFNEKIDYDEFEANSELYNDVFEAIQAVIPELEKNLPPKMIVKVGLVDVDTDWRARLLAQAETQQVTNQNSYARTPLLWDGMRFNSEGEIAIAQALEKIGVMYLPNCLARVGSNNNRKARFPDFLICFRGKWGILEVDGATYHTPTSATEDHERRRLIEHHGGVAYFDRFPYKRCMNEPDQVVKEFLNILATK